MLRAAPDQFFTCRHLINVPVGPPAADLIATSANLPASCQQPTDERCKTSRWSSPQWSDGIGRNRKDEIVRVSARIPVNRSAYRICAMGAIECNRIVIDGNDIKAGFGNAQLLERCQQMREQSLSDAPALVGAEQIESANAIPPSMAETDNLSAVARYQKGIAIAYRAPPSEFAFSWLKGIRLRAEQRGIDVPISLDVDPHDRWNIVKHSFADLDHLGHLTQSLIQCLKRVTNKDGVPSPDACMHSGCRHDIC